LHFKFEPAEDQTFARVSYTVTPNVQLSAFLGSGKDTGQKSNSYGIGLKVLPGQEAGDIKMGVMVRAQRVKIDTQGPFTLNAPYNAVTDGVNNTWFYGAPVNGTETTQYMQYDIFLGASTSTGTVRPYGGVALTKISGTDTALFSGSVPTMTCPVAGGVCTNATQNATFSSKMNISGNKMFSAVLGLDINPESALGMTLEGRVGTQSLLTLAGHLRF